MSKYHTPLFSWDSIDKIFLDLDGTLLDKYYDDYFWEHYVPKAYAKKHKVNPEECRALLLATYKSIENTLQWTDLDYWSDRLDMDIVALKKEIVHLVNIHPHVMEFLKHASDMGKPTYLVTNAHPKTLAVKLGKIKIQDSFTQIICSQDVGMAKEQVEFWEILQTIETFDKDSTLFVDDTERVLDSAHSYGIKNLIHIAKPSSKLPSTFSTNYPSIESFQALLFNG
ncbi:MAG: HAD superfamily hydrolase (TIGR01509 family) [Desulforhopalus sp.]|jgi:HAD superfamily hydrolase (TIGR01509 family)